MNETEDGDRTWDTGQKPPLARILMPALTLGIVAASLLVVAMLSWASDQPVIDAMSPRPPGMATVSSGWFVDVTPASKP